MSIVWSPRQEGAAYRQDSASLGTGRVLAENGSSPAARLSRVSAQSRPIR